METITLYYKAGSSDKVYQASIEPKDDRFVVNFAYGRRGATLQTGTKTTVPVQHGDARLILEKLVRDKTSKGYTPGPDGTPCQYAERKASGVLPQLLNAVDEDQLPILLSNKDHLMQEKKDGRRLMVQKAGTTITGINKLGLVTGMPAIVAHEVMQTGSDFILDGEIVGDIYHAFDLLELDGADLRERSYRERYLHLMNLLASFQHPHISLVESAHTPQQKRMKFQEYIRDGKEGVVFKDANASYTPGRPASGGTQLKYKFYETASLIVGVSNGKRSVPLYTHGGTCLGNVTIPANREIPATGEIVEVRYLYAYRGGSLFQPVFLGKRDDVKPEECTSDQLKFKPVVA